MTKQLEITPEQFNNIQAVVADFFGKNVAIIDMFRTTTPDGSDVVEVEFWKSGMTCSNYCLVDINLQIH
jgi:hypothetical protein